LELRAHNTNPYHLFATGTTGTSPVTTTVPSTTKSTTSQLTSAFTGHYSPRTTTIGTGTTGKFDFFSNGKHLFCSLKSSTDNITQQQ